MGSTTFSHVLAYTGSTHGLVRVVTDLGFHPVIILILMQLVLIILGTFMDQVSMMMICTPIYMPIIRILGFDPVWFCVIMLINLEVAGLSPPFGLMLFVMKGVVMDGTTMSEIIRCSFPFLLCGVLTMALLIAFPIITQLLPMLMSGG
jgi:TRAP-type C4-dicarboxylate transport system permease large subunit